MLTFGGFIGPLGFLLAILGKLIGCGPRLFNSKFIVPCDYLVMMDLFHCLSGIFSEERKIKI